MKNLIDVKCEGHSESTTKVIKRRILQSNRLLYCFSKYSPLHSTFMLESSNWDSEIRLRIEKCQYSEIFNVPATQSEILILGFWIFIIK